MKKKSTCKVCDGSGLVRCLPCKGLGLGPKDPPEDCRACWGKGTVQCKDCKGVGIIETDEP